jgi:hypothetical protein
VVTTATFGKSSMVVLGGVVERQRDIVLSHRRDWVAV